LGGIRTASGASGVFSKQEVRFAIELMGARPRKAPAGKVSENFVWRGCKAGKQIWGNLQICPNIGGFVRSKHETWGKNRKIADFFGDSNHTPNH